MKFAGMVKNSTVDYPGKIALVLFTAGCNFRCSYCQNYELMYVGKNECSIDENDIFKLLDKRKGLIDAVCITGGEPSLYYREIIEFFSKLKERYQNSYLLKIDTNGSNYEFLNKIYDEVDFIAMDYKGYSYSSFSSIEKEEILKSLKIVKQAKDYEIRITMYPEYIKESEFGNIIKDLKGVKKVAIQQYKNKKVFEDKGIEPYSNEVLEKFKIMFEQEGILVEIRK